MAWQIFLSGHGGWKPNDGWTEVPRGCKVHFYTHFAKLLMTGMEYQVLRGDYTAIDRTVEQYMMCPNMRLSPQPAEWTHRSEEELAKRNDPDCMIYTVDKACNLSELFEDYTSAEDLGPAEFHWIACQALQLKRVGGRYLGLNAEDWSHRPHVVGPKTLHYRLSATGSHAWV